MGFSVAPRVVKACGLDVDKEAEMGDAIHNALKRVYAEKCMMLEKECINDRL